MGGQVGQKWPPKIGYHIWMAPYPNGKIVKNLEIINVEYSQFYAESNFHFQTFLGLASFSFQLFISLGVFLLYLLVVLVGTSGDF